MIRFVSPLAIFGSSSQVCTVYFIPMCSRTSRIIAIVILVTCFVCPLVDMFDNWDHAMQTGNDTEYALVVLGLCIGVAFSFTRVVLRFALLRFVEDLGSKMYASKLLPFAFRGSFFVSPIPLSPFTLAL